MRATLLAVALGASACGGTLPPPPPPRGLVIANATGEVVVVVKVKPPWYATRGAITGKFRAAVPEYQAASGLLTKQFSFADNGYFGGIYRWRERAIAERWFGPAWHERVRKLRGVEGDIRFIDVTRTLEGALEPAAFEGPMVVAIAPGRLERYVGASGLRAGYEGQGLVVSTWSDAGHAEAFLQGVEPIEWFATPVGLVNSR